MKKYLLLVFLTISLYGKTINEIINKNQQLEEQKKIFDEQQKNKILKKNKTFEVDLLKIEKDLKEKNCIQINKINIKKSTIFKKEDFQEITKNYIGKCYGIKSLNNLKNKLSNMYLDKGYVTSRAYFKVQDLSDGIIDIEILEGKIEKIDSEGVYHKNLGIGNKEDILNLRELEVAIQQAQRLNSQEVNFNLLPGSKVGYSIVSIKGNKVSSPFYGNLSINNYGSKNRGQYQISTNNSYENPFNINDIISFSFNSTDKGFIKNNKYYGFNTTYSFPINRFLFDIVIDYSKYEQNKKDFENDDFKLYGDTKSIFFSSKYKIYHSQNDNLELISSLKYKENNNYLNNITLELQSYAYSVFNLALKYNHIGMDYNYFLKFSVDKSLSLFSSKNDFGNEEDSFTKYILDGNFTKYFSILNKLKYDFLFRGQYSNDNLYSSEEFSVGGPYSVRGFKENGLSGKSGFYIKNELGNVYNLNGLTLSPYVGLDIGYIKKEKNNLYGEILGSSLGLKTFVNNFNIEVFLNKALKKNIFTENNKKFIGFNINYNY